MMDEVASEGNRDGFLTWPYLRLVDTQVAPPSQAERVETSIGPLWRHIPDVPNGAEGRAIRRPYSRLRGASIRPPPNGRKGVLGSNGGGRGLCNLPESRAFEPVCARGNFAHCFMVFMFLGQTFKRCSYAA